MTGTLRDTIQQLAAEFAAGVLGVIRGASLEDILAETESVARGGRNALLQVDASRRSTAGGRTSPLGPSGRLPRRSAADIGEVVDQVVELLSGKPKGLRAEQIREALGLSSKELPRPIALALSSQRITKTGQKRATTYFVRGRTSGAATGGGGGRERGSGKAVGSNRAVKRAAQRSNRARAGSSAKPAARPSEETAKAAVEAS